MYGPLLAILEFQIFTRLEETCLLIRRSAIQKTSVLKLEVSFFVISDISIGEQTNIE